MSWATAYPVLSCDTRESQNASVSYIQLLGDLCWHSGGITDTLCPVFRGTVVTQECVEKLIKKDMTDPVTGDKLSDRDIIPLQRVSVYFCVELGENLLI